MSVRDSIKDLDLEVNKLDYQIRTLKAQLESHRTMFDEIERMVQDATRIKIYSYWPPIEYRLKDIVEMLLKHLSLEIKAGGPSLVKRGKS